MKKQKFPYPRPNLRRSNYYNLNGLWDYKIIDSLDLNITDYDGKIQVPFCLESKTSLVERKLKKNQILYYHLLFRYKLTKEKAIIHFEAINYHARIYLNKEYVGEHYGGYNRFSFDITPYLKSSNNLEVFVIDNCDKIQKNGKQVKKTKDYFYDTTSGISQSVWLEEVNDNYIKKYHYSYVNGLIEFTAYCNNKCLVTLTLGDEVYRFRSNKKVYLNTNLQTWSFDNPIIHYFTLENEVDKITGYFALREITLKNDSNKIKRFYLNEQKIFLNGVLYQGYHEGSNLTVTDDEIIIKDLLLIKKMGFNLIRVHNHIECLRFYYLCDKLGLLVMQDMVSDGKNNLGQFKNLGILKTINQNFVQFIASDTSNLNYIVQHRNKNSRILFEKELLEMLDNLQNFACVVIYSLFNEGWGQFDSTRLGNLAKRVDPTRIYDYVTAGYDFKQGEIQSFNIRFAKLNLPTLDGRLTIISKYGDVSMAIDRSSTSRVLRDSKTFLKKYKKLHEDAYNLIEKGLSGIIYSQFSDNKRELNGLVSFDRQKFKIPLNQLTVYNQELVNYFKEKDDE